MSLIDRIRWAVAPVQQRAMLLLWGGLAVFLASGSVASMFEIPAVVKWLLFAGMLAGWLAACAGMVGTVRYLFGHAAAEMRKVQEERMKDRP